MASAAVARNAAIGVSPQQAAQGGTPNAPFGYWNSPGMFDGGSTNSDLTSRLVNALRGAAKTNQNADRGTQGLLGKLFGDIGIIGSMFGFILTPDDKAALEASDLRLNWFCAIYALARRSSKN